jgi:hypothetical protein
MTTTLTSYVERSREKPDAMRRRAEASNTALERTAGSHSLAAAAHRQRSPHSNGSNRPLAAPVDATQEIEILVQAIRSVRSPANEKRRDAILKIDRDASTGFGRFPVDRDGVQRAQDGGKVIVWPGELAPQEPRFSTPPWNGGP